MKINTKIKVGISDEKEMNQEFISVWKKAEKGKIKAPQERLYFLDANTLLRILSNQRLALLHVLRHYGTMSIRLLSKELRRNYKNVYGDVQLLLQAGLIQKRKAQEIFVPWDKIQTEINLAT